MGSHCPNTDTATCSLGLTHHHGLHQEENADYEVDIDGLYEKNAEYERVIKQSNGISDNFDCQIRDTGKKVQKLETSMEEIMEKLQASAVKMDEAEKEFKNREEDVNT